LRFDAIHDLRGDTATRGVVDRYPRFIEESIMKLRRLPLRLATGAYILNSGVSKWNADEATAGQLHGVASTAYPQLKRVRPEQFARILAASELAVGAALLAPFIPPALAGAALTAFSSGLVGLYLRIPGMHEEGSLRPTRDGIPIAKDIWLLGIGLSLVLDGLSDDRD
jgi:uncharacterized membrane protein YphA (DoxX/SURF4 family)